MCTLDYFDRSRFLNVTRLSQLELQVGSGPSDPGPQPSLSCALDSMQELCNDMKLLAFDLQDNNRLIERLHRVPSAPDV